MLAYIHIYIYTCMSISIVYRISLHMYTYKNTTLYMYIYIYMKNRFVCIYICMSYVCLYTHTCMYVQIHVRDSFMYMRLSCPRAASAFRGDLGKASASYHLCFTMSWDRSVKGFLKPKPLTLSPGGEYLNLPRLGFPQRLQIEPRELRASVPSFCCTL